MKVHYFTFGMGQRLEGYCQPITADSPEDARDRMFEIYGSKWAFQYSEEEYLKARSEGHARESLLVPLIVINEQEERPVL